MTIDPNKPAKLKNPQKGEENLIFKITNLNEVTNRCYIDPISPMPEINPDLHPQELVLVSEIENV